MLAYLQLLRLPQLVAVASGVLAGGWVVLVEGGRPTLPIQLWLLVLASCSFYLAGVVFHEVVDAPYEIRICPERPVTNGRIRRRHGGWLVWLLLLVGLTSAACTGRASLVLALWLGAVMLAYNLGARGAYSLSGLATLATGIGYALNLCLGFSLVPAYLAGYAPLAVLPLLHVLAVIRPVAENQTPARRVLPAAVLCLVLLGLLNLVFGVVRESLFIVPLGYTILYLLVAALTLFPRNPATASYRRVRYGLVSLVLLEACLVAVFCPWIYAAVIVSLAALTWLLSFWFMPVGDSGLEPGPGG